MRDRDDSMARREPRPPDTIGRKHPAHGVHIDLGKPTIVFLTVCLVGRWGPHIPSKDRKLWLVCDEAHACLRDVWREAGKWTVGRYVLMPDHAHLFCAPHDVDFPLDAWVRFWKGQFTRRSARLEWRWQSHHWDTRLRRGENYSEKWEYVRQNPVRAGLVADADQWPYQGELSILPW
jgi:putative transposase